MSGVQPFIDHMRTPEEVADVGVRVELGKPVPMLCAAPGDERWGLFAFPCVWRLRDQRLVHAVTVGEDEYPSCADYHYLWYVSSDNGVHWSHVVPSVAEAEALLRERITLPSGVQLYFRRRLASLDALSADPCLATDQSVYYRLGDLPESCRRVRLFRREPDREDWTETDSAFEPRALLRLFKERVREPLPDQLLTHGHIATRLRLLTDCVGDDRLPDVGMLVHNAAAYAGRRDLDCGCDADTVARLRVPLPNFGRLHHLQHEQISECPDGSLIVPTRLNPLSVDEVKSDNCLSTLKVFRSADGGENWSFHAALPTGSFNGYRLCWPFRITPNMPAGNWLAVIRMAAPERWTCHSPLAVTRSYDEGRTWTTPEVIRSSSVNPVGGLLENGVAFRMYGRPGQMITFCADGEGRDWGSDVFLLDPLPDPDSMTGIHERSCCNSDCLVLGPDRFLVIYTDYHWQGPDGIVRKAVLAREVRAEPRSARIRSGTNGTKEKHV